MKRRLIAAVAALLLAITGAVLLLNYVAAADRRAMAGMETTTVLVVTEPVPDRTPAEDLTDYVVSRQIPAAARAEGAVASLDELSGQVATTGLEPGEQVLTGRFADPAALADADRVKVPKGLQQISVLLESQRVLGGQIVPGATVGVFITLEDQTHLTLHQVLVSRVQGGLAPAPADAATAKGDDAPAPLPDSSVMVTLAVSAADAEKIVYAAEHGQLWLSDEPTDATTTGTRIVTGKNVYS